jgi:hypothetical protein
LSRSHWILALVIHAVYIKILLAIKCGIVHHGLNFLAQEVSLAEDSPFCSCEARKLYGVLAGILLALFGPGLNHKSLIFRDFFVIRA